MGFRALLYNQLGPELIIGLSIQRETEGQVQVLNAVTVLDLELSFLRFQGKNAGKLQINDIAGTLKLNHMKWLQNVDRSNERTELLNRRVANVLAAVTDQEYTDDAKKIWQSWHANVGLEGKTTDQKTVVQVSEVQNEQVPATLSLTSCFVAGTPVLTEVGEVAIENIRLGDRVLAKDVETGELAFRTVMKTTIRKKHALTRVTVGADEILCTPGHRFWHSGFGWVQARDLKAGDLLHTVTGSVAVTAVEDEAADKTYNLIVDGFHSYFVGSEGLLAQDLLLPTPTNMVVPGLTRFEFNNAIAKRDAGE